MMHQQTMDKLREMKLNGLAAAWLDQQAQADYAGLGFDERLGLLVDAEWMSRQNARMKRNLEEAHLKLSSACLEDLDYDPRREIDKVLIRQLATCRAGPRPRRPRSGKIAGSTVASVAAARIGGEEPRERVCFGRP